jgi:hypothetical protein
MARSLVIGVFNTRDEAQRAVEELHQAGFPSSEISVVMHRDHHADVDLTDMDAAKAAYITGENKAGEGAAIGALAGGIGGGVLALGVGLIPGLGPVFAGGLLAAACFGVGAAVGATGGGIVGALIGQEFPEDEACFYEQELKAGRVLVGVKNPERLDEALTLLESLGGYHALSPATATAEVLHAPITQPMPAAGDVLPPQV